LEVLKNKTYDKLKKQTNKMVDKSVDDTQTVVKTVQNIEVFNVVSDPRIAEQRRGTHMKKAKI
jgi:hypothetical protein